MRKQQLDKIVEVVKSKIGKHDVDNIAICMPTLSKEDIKYLGSHFKEVKRELFGYVYFRIEEKVCH